VNPVADVQALFMLDDISLTLERGIQPIWRIDRLAPGLPRRTVVNTRKVNCYHAVFFILLKGSANTDATVANKETVAIVGSILRLIALTFDFPHIHLLTC
jgi:uncharacterized membrane protein